MATGIFFFLSIAVLLVLIFWFIREEKKPLDQQGMSGIFAMNPVIDPEKKTTSTKTKKTFRDHWPASNEDHSTEI